MNEQLPQHIWSMRKDGVQVDCEIREDPDGFRVRVFSNRTPIYVRCWPRWEVALAEAEELRAQYLRDGGIPIGYGALRCNGRATGTLLTMMSASV